MFKKLKEKITEEVKSSPQRFAEFTQSVSDKLGNNMSADENFFTIGEDDANTSANSTDHGFSSVALVSPSQESRFRRNSNSSVASDVSFLPRYESGSMYHLQSDLDVSASEIEDNASTASQIGHLSKEQIYSAFQKAQLRYHKYRGRYTDLARHYKELERENAKMKSVLVETQDKAIRRVTELKEQCSLEQKAKAHLEAALRDELDEKNFKIHSLQTKIELLQSGNNSDLLVNIDNKENQGENLENLTKYLNGARKEIEVLNEKIQEMKANSIVFQSKEQEYKAKILNLEKEITHYSEREKENNLKLAQNKMELHNEILSKDAEISTLKKDAEVLKQKLDAIEAESKANTTVKMENLQSQNKKLIDKVENLTQKCNNLESDLLKVEKYKLEIRELKETEERLNTKLSNYKTINEERINLLKLVDSLNQGLASFKSNIKKLSKENLELKENLTKERKDFENQILTIREDAKKGLLSLEPKIREKLQKEHLQREEELKRDFASKVEELSSINSSQKEMQLQLFEKDEIIKKASEELEAVKRELSKKVDDYYNLEKNHLELITDSSQLRNTVSSLEKEKALLENYGEKQSRLEAHILTLQEELKEIKDIAEKKEKENVYLSEENLILQQSNAKISEKVRIFEEKLEAVHLESSESRLLELKVQKLEEEKEALLNEFELERKMFNKMLEDHRDLKEKEEEIAELQALLNRSRHEVQHVEENLALERDKNVNLYDKKHSLEVEVEKLQEQVRIFEEKEEARQIDKSECRILELKLQKLEEENRSLLESFELERLTFANELEDIRQDLASKVQNDSAATGMSPEEISVERLKEKMRDIKRLSESKEKENVYLAEENLVLQQERDKLSEKLRLLEEKLETMQLEVTESKLLELKVQQLEVENKKLLDEIEMERKMFNDLLEDHKELKIKEETITLLEETLNKLHKEIISLRETLEAEKKENVHLGKEKFDLEGEVRKLTEKLRIAEEKEEAAILDRNECRLLEMKLGKLETENRNLLESFEMERTIFNKTYEQNAKNEAKIKDLIEENLQVKEIIKKGKESAEKLNVLLKDKEEEQLKIREENLQNLKKIDSLESKIKSQDDVIGKNKEGNESNMSRIKNLITENDKLRKEVEDKDKQLSDLSKNITNLSETIQKQTKEFNSLLDRTQQLESILEKIQTDSAEAIKREKERQNELIIKIEELQKELSEKTNEFASLSNKLTELEKLYAEEKFNYEEKTQEIISLQKKIAELQAVEESYRLMGEEKQVIDNELVRLKTIENKFQALENEKVSLQNKLKQMESEFKKKNSDMLQKFKITEQGCNLLKEEKENLLVDIKNLRSKIEEISTENNNLKTISAKIAESDYALEQLNNQNEMLQNERDNLNKEISQLNLRMNQISSDNRNIVEENQSLINSNEELKIKIEFLANEKGEFDEIKNKLTEEKANLTKKLDEVEQQLNRITKQNLELVNDRNLSGSNEIDISKIQQDFYEIKEKCDSLFVENKNLKSEYAKLEEKCDDFSKIKSKLETQIRELEHQYTEILHEKQLLQDEVHELKISPVNIKGNLATSKLDQLDILKQDKAFTTDAGAAISSSHIDKDTFLKEIEVLQDKLTQYKSLDITNKSSIEFYENELQKIKNQNEKLNRKLDETLVTLNHCTELTNSTEIEYLKNVLYNYMLGKESLVLARVIAAVCKFDPEQTETVLQREQQKQSLLGQLGLI